MQKYVVALFFAIFASTLTACANGDQTSRGSDATNTVIVLTETAEHRFKIELADDNNERRIGLMYRESLPADAGMLFDFERTQPISMWMKNTLIPLDMAFIDENGVIRRIAENTTPKSLESIRSGEPVMAVLEVNGGTFERLGIDEGDRVRHPIFNP